MLLQTSSLSKDAMGNACDIDDPFAMMGGMGEEEVYKVTMVEEKKEPHDIIGNQRACTSRVYGCGLRNIV